MDQNGKEKMMRKLEKRKLIVLKSKVHGPYIDETNSLIVWSLYSHNESLSLPIDPFNGCSFVKPEFELSAEMLDFIQSEIHSSTMDILFEKLQSRFGKLPKRSIEKRIHQLFSNSNSMQP